MKQKLKYLLVAVVSIIVWWYLFHGAAGVDELLAPVEVTQGMIVSEAEAVGYIKPKQFITVKSQIDGTVDAIYHDKGDLVKSGDRLAKIKPAPSPTEYAVAYQQLEMTTGQEKSAKKDLDRFEKALRAGLIATDYSEYISAQETYRTAKSARVLASQKLALIEKGETRVAGKAIENIVSSPIDGYILDRIVNVGDPVISLGSAQASTPLFTIADMNNLIFQGVVDEIDAAKIYTGMSAAITIGALPGKKVTGILNKIALQSEKENLTVRKGAGREASESPFNIGFEVEIGDLSFEKGLELRSGYSATAKIQVDAAEDILILPLRVIHFEEDKTYVLVRDTEEDEDTTVLRKQYIETGLSDNVNIEIKRGLALGQKVIDLLGEAEAIEIEESAEE